MNKIKTIDIQALEWFDRINGNSYFAATVTVNYGLKDAKEIKLPFQYGYGDHYKHMCFQQLRIEKIITDQPQDEIFWRYCDRKKIILRASKKENCKKRELTNL